jgi:hypothetical protein
LEVLGLIATKLRIERLVLVGHDLTRRRLCLLDADGAQFLVWRVDARRQRGEVATAISEFILNRERREATEAPSSFVCLLKALGEQSPLQREGVEW